jgi:hypothetical protein
MAARFPIAVTRHGAGTYTVEVDRTANGGRCVTWEVTRRGWDWWQAVTFDGDYMERCTLRELTADLAAGWEM